MLYEFLQNNVRIIKMPIRQMPLQENQHILTRMLPNSFENA